MKHHLYRTGDKDAPAGIKDRNGAVVLSQCRACGRGEAELDETPNCPAAKAEMQHEDLTALQGFLMGMDPGEALRIGPMICAPCELLGVVNEALKLRAQRELATVS